MAENAEPQVPKLSDIYNEIYEIYEEIERGDEPSASDNIQVKLRHAIAAGEKAIHMVNELNLFSTNESIEEVATNEIRYILLPAYLGYFVLQKMRADRLETVKKAQDYYLDFLRLCKYYGLTDIEVPKAHEDTPKENSVANTDRRLSTGAGDVIAMARRRNSKIERFKQQKETEKKLQELHKHISQPHVDEDVKREYYTTLINRWIGKTMDDLESIDSEIQILQYMDMRKNDGSNDTKAEPSKEKPENKKKFRPFILTRDQVQAKVFGAGYPSIPTYSVEEFYEQQVAAGKLPTPEEAQKMMKMANRGPDAEETERKAIEKEEKEERDDPEQLQKARDWDDWKDDHRRGWGNRQNMG